VSPPTSAAGLAAEVDGDQRRQEREDEQVEAVAVDDAGEDRDEQRHEDPGAGVDEDGDDQRREGGRRDVGQGGGPRLVAEEELGAAERIVGAHERQVADDDEGEQAAADVAAQGLRVLDADVDQRGDDHRQHQEHAAEEGEPLLRVDLGVLAEEPPVGDEGLVDVGGDAVAGLHERLAARDAHLDGPDGLGGGLLPAGGGVAIEDQVGRQAEPEEPEDRLG
jgi:hypothetical protein